MQQTMHDIFYVEFAIELEGTLASTRWSELPEELVKKMVDSAKKHIQMAEHDPLPRKLIVKRLREFYSNRRSLTLVKENTDKRRLRRSAMKRSSILYVSCFVLNQGVLIFHLSFIITILEEASRSC